MSMLVRHVASIAALPFMAAVVIPVWLATRYGALLQVGDGLGALLIQFAGCQFAVAGLLLFASSLRRFVSEGQGTLAPWDPPRRMVVRGPYRYVRNPMIAGVLFVLIGEALLLISLPHLLWALLFLAVNAVYIPLHEEPRLKRRFGPEYAEYCRHVNRFVPSVRPWNP